MTDNLRQIGFYTLTDERCEKRGPGLPSPQGAIATAVEGCRKRVLRAQLSNPLQ